MTPNARHSEGTVDDTANDTVITSFEAFTQRIHYSLMETLQSDPQATSDGHDHQPREVRSGHYVPVAPTPMADPIYVSHSNAFFKELGISDDLANSDAFTQVFSGNLSAARPPMRTVGWATGYALSIFGQEYTQQCPFRTGNGYGDGRAISILETVIKGRRWEMQLKGAGPTPYCRGADGRAVLRSSVREFLAQDYMHALGVPTSRSFTLFVSATDTVMRPWYSEGSYGYDPDIMVDNPIAISTRVAPSFLRVGQVELFARRTRTQAHPHALSELKMIVEHLIEREYKDDIDQTSAFSEQLVQLATLFRQRLTSLVAHWIRVGYCQGNFNSDNCAAGGFTLDYGPFGFCELFDPVFQPWTGGGQHFSFFNQPAAAEANFHMFWTAIRPLLADDQDALNAVDQIRNDFTETMKTELHAMWAKKLGMPSFHSDIFSQLMQLMQTSKVDYSLFFRELSHVPDSLIPLQKSFYEASSAELDAQWQAWLTNWRHHVLQHGQKDDISTQMKQTNPKYTWREWLVAPAYQQAAQGDFRLLKELQTVFSKPYAEQTPEIEKAYYRLKPEALFNVGGVSHYSCSS